MSRNNKNDFSFNRRLKRHNFNIIEVTLAVALLAFGFASVMGLFALAVKRSKSADTINMSSSVSEEFMGYLENKAKESVTDYESLFGNITGVGGALSEDAPGSAGLKNPAKLFSTADSSIEAVDEITDSSDSALFFSDNIYPYSENGYYFFVNHVPGNKKQYDLAICFYVWKSPVPELKINASEDGLAFNDTTDEASEAEWNRLNIEASWPIDAAYDKRETRRYYVDIKRPN